MPIIGLNINSINAEISDKMPRGNVNININSTPKITGIEKKDVNMIGMDDVISFSFSFETKYEPDIGKIAFTGEVLYQSLDAKNILNKWKKEKKINDELAVEILNSVFRKCLSKGVDIASELRLPPPISFPLVRTKDEAEEYVG